LRRSLKEIKEESGEDTYVWFQIRDLKDLEDHV
jgi:hypothetical protein